MADADAPAKTDDDDELPPRPSYDDNPAIIDAHRTFLVTLLVAALFIGAVVSFIL